MNVKEHLGLDSLNKDKNGKKWTHERKYTSIVNALGKTAVYSCIPAAIDRLRNSNDPYFNDIQLRLWDASARSMRPLFKAAGITSVSLSDGVCTLKQAAKMMLKENN